MKLPLLVFGRLIRTSPCGGFSGHVQLGGDSEQTQNTLGGLKIPSGLGAPRDSREEPGDAWDTFLSLLLTGPGLTPLHPFIHDRHQMEAPHHQFVWLIFGWMKTF